MHASQAVTIAAAVALSWSAIAAVTVIAQKPAQRTNPTKQKTNKSCQISASGVDFGIYDTLAGTPLDAAGSVTYSCSSNKATRSQNVLITIDQGRAGSFDRTMTFGAETLHYNVYLDVGRTRIWGDGSGGTSVLEDKVPPNDHLNTAPVYGRVTPRQNVSAGRYTDGLIVTIQF